MSTNITSIPVIEGFWDSKYVETSTCTDVMKPIRYFILTFPEMIASVLQEEKRNDIDENLKSFYLKFADEDINLAELGMKDYCSILQEEDN